MERPESQNPNDGDTITVLVDKKPIKIRFEGIDAPEAKQDSPAAWLILDSRANSL
jgi:endonuclease YncB( thermonuclease family)